MNFKKIKELLKRKFGKEVNEKNIVIKKIVIINQFNEGKTSIKEKVWQDMYKDMEDYFKKNPILI